MKKSKAPLKLTRILIVDDHPMTREGLAHLIGSQPGLAVCAEAGTASAALAAVEKCKPDLVLSDITLPDKSGIELIKNIKAVRPGLPVLVLSMHDEMLYAERVLKAGAAGYIMKICGGEKLLEAIRRVLVGEIYASEKISARLLKTLTGKSGAGAGSSVDLLSDRELEVFRLIGQGISTKEIGGMLHLSAKTVEAHRLNIKAKLGIDSVGELISFAARWMAETGTV